MTKAAREWLNDPNEYAGLLGASWLLLAEDGDCGPSATPEVASEYVEVSSTDGRHAVMANRASSETSSRMSRWLEARDSLSLPMQWGPSEFMAERFARVDNQNLAIGEWLRIAATYPQFRIARTWLCNLPVPVCHLTGTKTQLENIQKWQAELSGQ